MSFLRCIVCLAALCLSAFSVRAAGPLQRVPNTTLSLPAAPPVYGYMLTTLTNTSGANISFPNIVGFASAPGETNRLFIIEKLGYISVITNMAAPNRTVFLDISSKVIASAGTSEGGLLGVAFHPAYATNGQFYVFYVGNDDTTAFGGGNGIHDFISRFTNAPGANVAAAATEQKLIRQFDRKDNHNAGCVRFGPDGYLYVSLGDEGFGPANEQNDYWTNSQHIDKNFFAGMIRIDVDKKPGNLAPNLPHPAIVTNAAGQAYYSVPADNPFIGRTSFNSFPVNPAKVRTEFYAVGLRNPWQFSFDSATGILYLGNVGWVNREGIYHIKPGQNYGWSYREGSIDGPRKNLEPATGFTNTLPIFEYAHPGQTGGTYGTNTGYTVMGGVVYRGSRISQLTGYYVFGDYNYSGSQPIWAFKYDGTNISGFKQLTTESQVVAYGIDPSNGDVLLADNGDSLIRRLVYNTNSIVGTPLPATLAATGAFTNLNTLASSTTPLTPHAGVVPFDINVPFWSDNAIKTRWLSVPKTNLTIGFNPTNNWSFPTGTVWIKHFDLLLTNGVASSSKRLETRFIVKNTNGVYGITYRWGNSLTNATLVPEEGMDETFVINAGGGILRTQVWHYPSRLECLACHTTVGGGALGFNTAQLHRDRDYNGTITNELQALSEAGYFSAPVTNIHLLRALASPTNAAVSLEYRVRSYLAANCVQCHQPGGAGSQQALWDARLTTPLPAMGVINGPLLDNIEDPNNRVIIPGDLAHSVMLFRIAALGEDHMPPLATSVINTQAVALMSAWITNGLAGYQSFADWQITQFGSTNAATGGASQDFDSDRASNYQEYLTGTDPKDPQDYWAAGIQQSGGSAWVNYPQVANRGFEVQSSTNPVNAASWTPMDVTGNEPFFAITNRTGGVTDPVTGLTNKLYRVRVFEP